MTLVKLVIGKPPALLGDSKSLTDPGVGRGNLGKMIDVNPERRNGGCNPPLTGMNTFGGFRFATPTLQQHNVTDHVFVFHRLRIGPFEGPAIVKPPALPGDTYSG